MIEPRILAGFIVAGICTFAAGVSWYFWAWLVKRGTDKVNEEYSNFTFADIAWDWNGGYAWWGLMNILISIAFFSWLATLAYRAFVQYFEYVL